MNNRQELQLALESILGSRNVYYQPPESVKLVYPAIVYTRTRIDTTPADDMNYIVRDVYSITFIHKNPDDDIVHEILTLPRCAHERKFESDNLHHDVYRLTI